MPIRDNKDAWNDYFRAYMSERYKERFDKAVVQLGGKCISCGSIIDLQFDHIDPKNKKFSIGKSIVSISETKLQEELKKCQLLCGPCHHDKNLTDRGIDNPKLTHGTVSSYRYCHCQLCRNAKNLANKRSKAKHKL